VFYRRTFEAAAGPLAIEPIAFPIHGMADIDRAVTSLGDSQNAGAFFAADATTNARQVSRPTVIIALAQARGIISFCGTKRLGASSHERCCNPKIAQSVGGSAPRKTLTTQITEALRTSGQTPG
jgi:hypothetical protein